MIFFVRNHPIEILPTFCSLLRFLCKFLSGWLSFSLNLSERFVQANYIIVIEIDPTFLLQKIAAAHLVAAVLQRSPEMDVWFLAWQFLNNLAKPKVKKNELLKLSAEPDIGGFDVRVDYLKQMQNLKIIFWLFH